MLVVDDDGHPGDVAEHPLRLVQPVAVPHQNVPGARRFLRAATLAVAAGSSRRR